MGALVRGVGAKRVAAAEAGIKRTWQWLTACNQGSSPSSPIAIIFLVFLLRLFFLHKRFHNLLDVANLDQNVLWFQIGMDDTTVAMQVIQTQEDLFRDLFDQRHWDATMIPALNQPEKIFPQHLKHHTDMNTIGSAMLKRIQEANNMLPARVVRVSLDDFIKKFNLINSRFSVMSSRSHNFQGNVFAICGIA